MTTHQRENIHPVGIVVLFQGEEPVSGDSFPAVPLYACLLESWSAGLLAFDRERGSWRSSSCEEIETTWVLFLEETEKVTRDQITQLADIAVKQRLLSAELYVTRFISVDHMSRFSWVTTTDLYTRSHPGLTDYHTTELRFVSAGLLPDRVTVTHQPDQEPYFLLSIPQEGSPTGLINFTIAGETPPPMPRDKPGYTDEDVFREGHQQYFNDTEYCASFNWPRTSYNTMRFEHIPSILEGLRQGLSTPILTTYALVYLIRFRDFRTAGEVASLIPDKWLREDNDLLTAVATVRFAEKEYHKARQLMLRAVENAPDNLEMARNAVKMEILTDNPKGAEQIEQIYVRATGRPLEDNFLDHFRSTHGEAPGTTASVSLCTVVKDESGSLERCLASVSDLVDEMVIVDTGSKDDTVRIAERYGARVVHSPWQDDFSSARNTALDHARCDYVLVLDADEYLSPFLYVEGHALKKILPLSPPQAFRIPVGYYFTESDWYFLVSEAGNFRRETEQVRLFPRLPGIHYQGRIQESVEQDLVTRGVPVSALPEASFHILHDRQDREPRIRRKISIYRKVEHPDLRTILAAIQDHSYLGDTHETVCWMECYLQQEGVNPATRKGMGMRIAGILASRDAERAERFYKDLMALYPDDPAIPVALAGLYLSRGHIKEIANISFPYTHEGLTGRLGVRLPAYLALQRFILGDVTGAVALIEDASTRFGDEPFFPALASYILLVERRIEEALYPLSRLYQVTGKTVNREIDSMEDFLAILEELCNHLRAQGLHEERALLLAGALSLEK